MFEQFRNRQAIPEILALQPRARDNIFLCDASGLAERLTGSWAQEYRKKLLVGDLSRVAESDRYLAQLKDQIPHSRTFVNTANVVGSLPIVPAYLAGSPMNMRQRTRAKRPAGPLSIFLECTGSAGASRTANERGAAMLALVRALNEYRSVDLWLCVTYGQKESMNGLLCHVETRPLDLARAAHMLASLQDTAACGASVLQGLGCSWHGGWSYGVPELERKWCGEIFKRFLHPGSDVLYVPAALFMQGGRGDQWQRPVDWLKEMLAKYGGETIQEED